MDNNFCGKCGCKINGDMLYCPKCGNVLKSQSNIDNIEENENKQDINEKNNVNDITQEIQTEKENDSKSVKDKEETAIHYTFRSANVVKYIDKVTQVNLYNDSISIFDKRKTNKIKYDEIKEVQISYRFSLFYLFIIILAAVTSLIYNYIQGEFVECLFLDIFAIVLSVFVGLNKKLDFIKFNGDKCGFNVYIYTNINDFYSNLKIKKNDIKIVKKTNSLQLVTLILTGIVMIIGLILPMVKNENNKDLNAFLQDKPSQYYGYDVTYNDAFKEYFQNSSWEHFYSENDNSIIEFNGSFKYKGKDTKIIVQYMLVGEVYDLYTIALNDEVIDTYEQKKIITSVFNDYIKYHNLSKTTSATNTTSSNNAKWKNLLSEGTYKATTSNDKITVTSDGIIFFYKGKTYTTTDITVSEDNSVKIKYNTLKDSSFSNGTLYARQYTTTVSGKSKKTIGVLENDTYVLED